MIVEDSDDDFEALAQTLRAVEEGVELVRFSDGESAVAHLRSLHTAAPRGRLPRLVLLDLNLPMMGGREVLQELKSGGAMPAIPVVILTTRDLRTWRSATRITPTPIM